MSLEGFEPVLPLQSGSQMQLTDANPEQWLVSPGWQPTLGTFWAGDAGRGLQAFLQRRLAEGAVIFPPTPMRALELTPLESVRVVILGQDPYHGVGQAEGLAFSVAPGVRLPPSLRNIFKELQRDLGQPIPTNGSLVRWAEQGVLLLNTSLTVEEGQAASHAKRGWESLTDALVQLVSRQPQPVVFMLWGAHAIARRSLIDADGRHLVLTSNHPSPLSARRPPEPFIGSGHFGKANRWLEKNRLPEISWGESGNVESRGHP